MKELHKEYKKSSKTRTDEITGVDNGIANKMSLADRINTTAEKEAFITLKDHKNNFKNKPRCRLINPCKPEIGKISKQLLENIVKYVKAETKLNHWKNTGDVITWFENIKDKKTATFISFEICDFYPSITDLLLENATLLTLLKRKNISLNTPKGPHFISTIPLGPKNRQTLTS